MLGLNSSQSLSTGTFSNPSRSQPPPTERPSTDHSLRSDSPDSWPQGDPNAEHQRAENPGFRTAEEQLGRPPQIDDIKIDPHPHNGAGKRTRYCAYEDYTTDLPEPKQTRPPSASVSEELESPFDNAMPWTPFSTRIDFEFAQLMQAAQLKSSQVDDFVTMVRKILAAPQEFSLKDGKQVRDTWTSATRRYGQGVRC